MTNPLRSMAVRWCVYVLVGAAAAAAWPWPAARGAQQGDGGKGAAKKPAPGGQLFDDLAEEAPPPREPAREPKTTSPPGRSPRETPARDPLDDAMRDDPRADAPADSPDADDNDAPAPRGRRAPRAPAAEPARRAAPAPVPDQPAQDKALKLVKDVFAEDYRKRAAEDRLALARRLLETAGDEGNDAATQYVMLREARDLAAGAGDVPAALAAIKELAGSFAVNGVDLQLEVLTAAARKPMEPAQAGAAVEALLELCQQALVETSDVERAAKIVVQAEPLAKRAKDADLVARVAARRKDLRELGAQTGSIPALKDRLKKDPADPGVNLALGKFYCLGAGDWARGLPMLARGTDAALRKLAQADAAAAAARPGEQVAVGDGWWDLAEKQPPGLARTQLRARAGYWYGQAAPELAGLERTRVDKRLASVEAEQGGPASAGSGGSGAGSAASSGDKAAGVLRALVRKLPADARPRPGQPWDGARVGRWLTRQAFNTPFAAELTLTNADVSRDNGRNRLFAAFESVGPVEADGVSYRMLVTLNTAQEVPAAVLAKLQPGVGVRVKAVVRSISADVTESRSNGLDAREVQFYVSLANPAITVLARPPAPATAEQRR